MPELVTNGLANTAARRFCAALIKFSSPVYL